MRRLVVSLVLAVASPAAAQPGSAPPTPSSTVPSPAAGSVPQHGFVGGNGSMGGDELINGSVALEGGVRVPTTPLWLYGMASTGSSGDASFEGGGAYRRWIAGVELRACDHRGTECKFVGVDAGRQHQTWEKSGEPTTLPIETHDGTVLVVRFGVDAGGLDTELGVPWLRGLRIRGALELYGVDWRNVSDPGTSRARYGAMLVFGLAYQL